MFVWKACASKCCGVGVLFVWSHSMLTFFAFWCPRWYHRLTLLNLILSWTILDCTGRTGRIACGKFLIHIYSHRGRIWTIQTLVIVKHILPLTIFEVVAEFMWFSYFLMHKNLIIIRCTAEFDKTVDVIVNITNTTDTIHAKLCTALVNLMRY